MANSPRPGVWALERSVDHGQTWQTWQYFGGNDAECQKYFNMHADEKIVADDQVICSTEFSKVSKYFLQLFFLSISLSGKTGSMKSLALEVKGTQTLV